PYGLVTARVWLGSSECSSSRRVSGAWSRLSSASASADAASACSARRTASASLMPRSRYASYRPSRSDVISSITRERSGSGSASPRLTRSSTGANRSIIASLQASLQEIEQPLERLAAPLPPLLQPLPPRRRQRIDLAPPLPLAPRPLPPDQLLRLQPVQDRVQRAVLEHERALAPLLHVQRDLVAVLVAIAQRGEHQQLVDRLREGLGLQHGALHDVRPAPPLSFVAARTAHRAVHAACQLSALYITTVYI